MPAAFFWRIMNIVLIGYRCSGKTVTGLKLAARLGRPFVDTDACVVREAGASVGCIVRDKGWQYFRDLESRVIRLVTARDDRVISTGGGAVLRTENVRSLRDNGWVVWLKACEGTLRRRMEKDAGNAGQRPAIEAVNPSEETAMILRTRIPLYEEAADFHVATDTLSPSQAVERILASMRE